MSFQVSSKASVKSSSSSSSTASSTISFSESSSSIHSYASPVASTRVNTVVKTANNTRKIAKFCTSISPAKARYSPACSKRFKSDTFSVSPESFRKTVIHFSSSRLYLPMSASCLLNPLAYTI